MVAREGHKAFPVAAKLTFPSIETARRATILLLVHDASRTGAPVLGWNIAKALGASYDVVTVMMRKGELEPWFIFISAAAVGPLVWEDWHRTEFEQLADRLIDAYAPKLVIANSVETSALVPSLGRRGVPVVALIHEFAAYVRPASKMADMLNWAACVVFPAQVIAAAARRTFPALTRRHGIHVLSQGRTETPHDRPAPETLAPATDQLREPGSKT